jgi:adenosylhomocysteinase
VNDERNSVLESLRLIVLEHILPTTVEFLEHLHAKGVHIFSVLAKPYSIDKDARSKLSAIGISCTDITYAQLETTAFLDDLLKAAVNASKIDRRPILILDVGGYFAAPLTSPRLPVESPQFIAGVVEDTTFGHNRYMRLLSDIAVPVFSVARSSLKEIEARFVGRDAVGAVETVLRNRGVSIAGRNALVIGYGMIGSNVARSLRAHDLNVHVYDREDFKNLRAFIDGFYIHKKLELLKKADVIFAATADRALSIKEMEECKDNVILASVGSKDTEFDMASLRRQAVLQEALGPYVVKYKLAHSKNLMVIKDGTAVNFLLPSLPIEILDLVFSEILLCMMHLLKKGPQYPASQRLYQVPDHNMSDISKHWLRVVNH